ncbi:DUF1127 domain-containing protein [Roseibium denhamense]|uniref:YjiS-like domain-containing protein n=1 Tax=Roseibium denhamense TaxID=76305 RepID=A0ABY1PMM1_9HYPH|nr:DUF1127 domain-containing protein [Roseibium denhamense]MTI05534.1 DUF1127 domain-containing protein [Roseibium denhamense]SMP35143.1 protein of unknown function [Roseibium denhamense]
MSLEITTVFRSRAHNRSLLLSALHSLADRFRRHMQRRATFKALDGLNEHELEDIGLMRTGSGYRELRHDRFGAAYWKN